MLPIETARDVSTRETVADRVANAWVILRTLWLMLVIDGRLKFLPFRDAYTWATRKVRAVSASRTADASVDTATVIASTRQTIERASRFYYRARKDCLPKAFLAYYLLNRAGVSGQLCIAVRKFPFKAHAWVEYEGRIVFTTIADIPKYTVIHRS
jgi:transglutaminase superfamily protein